MRVVGNQPNFREGKAPAMAVGLPDLRTLLSRLNGVELRPRARCSLERVSQTLIDAEATAMTKAHSHERSNDSSSLPQRFVAEASDKPIRGF